MPHSDTHAVTHSQERHDLTTAIDGSSSECRGIRLQKRPWTATDIAALRSLFPHYSAKDVARMIGRTHWAVHYKAAELSLLKSAKVKSSIYRASSIRRPRGIIVQQRAA